MLTGILLFILFAVFAMLYLESFWTNALTLINVVLAAILAMSFFEPAAQLLTDSLPSFTYLWDYLMLWLMFMIFFGLLRGLTDLVSRTRVKFRTPIEMPGRLICALLVGLVLVGFITTSFHIAPLPTAPFSGGFGKYPDSGPLLGLRVDTAFLNLVQMTSRGSLSRGAIEGQPVHPDDTNANVNAFDPLGDFIFKYRQRRRDLEREDGLRVNVGT